MDRVMSTTNSRVVANGINLGYTPRVRDCQTGRFVSWCEAKQQSFGFNGSPVSYNHTNSSFTFRAAPCSIKEGEVYSKYGSAITVIKTSRTVTQDRIFPVRWRSSDTTVGGWDNYISKNPFVIELYM